MQNREKQKQQRKRDILIAALYLFIDKGYSGTKIQDIAKKVGMSMGLLFHYYASKEDLFLELLHIARTDTQRFSFLFEEGDPVRYLRRFNAELLHYIYDSDFAARLFVFMMRCERTTDIPEKAKSWIEANVLHDILVPHIREAQLRNMRRPGDPLALSLLYWGAVASVAENIVLFPQNPRPEIEWLARILLDNV